MTAPNLYVHFGQDLLGPWERLDPAVQEAWVTLSNQVASRQAATPWFWEQLGTDEAGMATHLPMGVNADGQGPENDSDAHHYECWCADPNCQLTKALRQAWVAGARGFHDPGT